MHPQYKNLNVATKSLLGLATMICRMIVLQHSEHPEDQEKGFQWFVIKSCNASLPHPRRIIALLPPGLLAGSAIACACNVKDLAKVS